MVKIDPDFSGNIMQAIAEQVPHTDIIKKPSANEVRKQRRQLTKKCADDIAKRKRHGYRITK